MGSIAVLPGDRVTHYWSDFQEGQIAKTVSCTIAWPDGHSRRSVLKAFTTENGQGLLNEIMGYLLARHCGLPVSPRAALVELPELMGPPPGALSHGFAVHELPGQTPGSLYDAARIQECKSLITLIRDWSKAPAAVAFDDWVANSDRNAGNLLVAGPDEVYLIDHTHLPVTMNWTPEDLNRDLVVANQLARLLGWNEQSHLPIKSSIAQSADSHYHGFENAEQELTHWLEALLKNPGDREAVLTFFRERARNGRERLSSVLKLIA